MPSRLVLGASAALLFALPACTQQSSDSGSNVQSIDVSDRAAIEAIVRDYLISNPEVLVEAFEALEEKQRQEEIARVKSDPELLSKIENDPRDFAIGPADAPITVVEYFDYLCGFCKRSVDQVMQLVDENPGKIRLVFKEFPILSEESEYGAKAALAAKNQDRYLDMHLALMEATQDDLNEVGVRKIATDLGLDADKLIADISSEDIARQIEDIRATATASGTNATPSFFVNGHKVAGANFAALNTLIENADS